MLVSPDYALLVVRKDIRNVQTAKILLCPQRSVGVFYFFFFHPYTSWLRTEERGSYSLTLEGGLSLKFLQSFKSRHSPSPVAGLAVQFKGCKQSPQLPLDPSGPLPLSSVIVNGRCVCSHRAMSDPKGTGSVLREGIVCSGSLEAQL